jgi:hypothetical protein
MKECDKPNSHKSGKLHIIYITSNIGRHPVTNNFTLLYNTSPNYTSLHFISIVGASLLLKLHPTTLHYTCRHSISFNLNFTQQHFTPLHYTCRHFTSSHFYLTQLHFTPLHYTSPNHTSLHC